MKRLAQQTAIVYGASGPIGARVATALGREGANVVVHYFRNEVAANAVVSEVKSAGAQVVAIRADVTKEQSVSELLRDAAAQFGSIDCIINCAHGAFEPKHVADLTWDDWRVHLDALKGHFIICKSVLPIMRKQRHGRIVFVSGGLSHRLFGGFSAFSTVKAGLNAFSKTLALEEGPYGITVNIVAPGKVETEISVQQNPAAWQDIEAHQLSGAPLGRHASMQDVVEAVLFFLSPGSGGMTGQILFVAGGEVMP